RPGRCDRRGRRAVTSEGAQGVEHPACGTRECRPADVGDPADVSTRDGRRYARPISTALPGRYILVSRVGSLSLSPLGWRVTPDRCSSQPLLAELNSLCRGCVPSDVQITASRKGADSWGTKNGA